MITLENVLIAKENRVARRELFQLNQALPVLTFSLNIPGSVKDSNRIRKIFRAGIERIEQEFLIEKSQSFYEETGLYSFFLIREEPNRLKEICCQIENEGSFHRLWDLDVNDSMGKAVALAERRQGRKCFLCDQLSSQCMRNQLHSQEEVFRQVENLFYDFFAQASRRISATAERYGACATEAALFEAASFPSPGLVDPLDSGSHSDMDYFTFLRSTAALSLGFARFAEAGIQHQGQVQELLPVLRRIGMEAEEEMFGATSGVNTQKGLLFSLGLVLGATGFLVRKDNKVSIEGIQAVVKEMTTGLVEAELRRLRQKEKLTAGEMIYQKFSLSGIRGEVEGGFPSVFQVGLPALERALAMGCDLHQSLMLTLVSLMSVVEDTTILWRSPELETLKWVQDKAKQFMGSKVLESANWRKAMEELNQEFIAKNISPGGSADLVAVTWYYYKIKNNLKK
jgi:holo-ACP synthase/triphosphoribosyl-dephospho-CoA synthase